MKFVSTELLNDLMIEHGETIASVAETTESSERSVYRWLQYGMLIVKWELLKSKMEISSRMR